MRLVGRSHLVEVEHACGVALELLDLDHARVLPQAQLVLAEAVRRHQLLVVLRPEQRTHLPGKSAGKGENKEHLDLMYAQNAWSLQSAELTALIESFPNLCGLNSLRGHPPVSRCRPS